MKTITISFFLIFVSCTTVPNIDEMNKSSNVVLPKAPEEGKALVYIIRPYYLRLTIRFKVYLDSMELNSQMGYTRGREFIYFNITPGNHTILSKADDWDFCIIDAKPGETIFIKQIPSIAIGFLGTRTRNSIKQVSVLEGKYYYRSLSLGNIIRLNK